MSSPRSAVARRSVARRSSTALAKSAPRDSKVGGVQWRWTRGEPARPARSTATTTEPRNVIVIGSGPSGYTAARSWALLLSPPLPPWAERIADFAWLLVAQLLFAYAFDMLLSWWRRDPNQQGGGLLGKLVGGAKRVLFNDDYYPALSRPNVQLVTDSIERIEPAHRRLEIFFTHGQ